MSDNFYKSSFTKRYKSPKESSFDNVKIDLNDGATLNFVQIFSIICDTEVTLNSNSHTAYLNILVYLSKDLLKEYHNKDFFMISIFSIVKFSLWNDSKLVRTAALRCLRYYLLNCNDMDLFLKMRVDFLIMRSLDLSYDDAINNQYRSNDDAERIHAMRLLYRLSLISPKLFPFSLINTLTMICVTATESTGNVLDIAVRPALLILCQLLILHPNLSSKNEILNALQTVIYSQDGKPWILNFRIIEAVLLTQMKLITHLSWRSIMPSGYFNKTLTPFSILSKVQSDSMMDNAYFRNFTNAQSEFESTSISILLTILQSWSGLLYLYGSNNKPIVSLTGLLQVGCSSIRGRILDLLFQLFDIFRPPADCKDFVSCIRAIVDQNSGKYRPNWNLDDDFLVAQCNDCLPHISGNRINIIDNYQAVLLGIFIQNNLFEALECAVSDDNESISARAGILLANIAYKASILLPADHPLHGKSDASMLFDNPKSQKALLWIHQVHKLLEQNQFQMTPFLMYLIQQHPNNNISDDGGQSKHFLQPANIDEILDSCCLPMGVATSKKALPLSSQTTNKNCRVATLLDQIVRYSHLFDSTNDKAFYDFWDWDLLMVFARSLVDLKSMLNVDKESLSRVLKKLMKFFTIQSSHGQSPGDYTKTNDDVPQFASMPLTWKHSSNAAYVITDIICYLVESSKDSESNEDLDLFLSTFYSSLKDCLLSIVEEKYINIAKEQFGDPSVYAESSMFSEYELNYKCSSFLILALGRISSSEMGETLLEKSGIVSLFKAFLDYSRSDVFTKLILGSLDYTRPALGRSLISIAIRTDNLLTRRYSTKFLKVLLRAKVPFFANWGINLLMKQLHDCDSIVKQAAFEILQEASEDEVVVNNLSVESIATLHVDFAGFMLFSRLLSLPSHFDKLKHKNGVNFFLDNWKTKYNLEYCKQVDVQLMQYFTTYDIPNNPTDDPDENRLSNRIKYKPKELILPFHPYGSISEHKEGMDTLLNRGELQECVTVLVTEWNELCDSIYNEEKHANFLSVDEKELIVRSSMFAICHVATSAWGLEVIIDMDIPLLISRLTRFHPSFNVRGTGLLCLGLLGSTRRGANVLIDYEWLTLRSDRRDKWPLLLDVFHNVQQNRSNIKKHLQMTGDNELRFNTKSMFIDDTVRHVQLPESNLGFGFSVFALPLPTDDVNDLANRKISFELMNTRDFLLNNSNIKLYSKSFDESFTKSRATTGFSSFSNGIVQEDEQGKLSKLIRHHRDLSIGAASMFTVPPDDMPEAFSPHDVLGIATMRRLQRKSRSGIFNKANLSLPVYNNSDCTDQYCCDSSDQRFVGIFSNLRKASVCVTDVSKRRKKLSSLLNPRSNLNKYRGLVLPINFNDLTVSVFEDSSDTNSKRLSSTWDESYERDINVDHFVNDNNDIIAEKFDSFAESQSVSGYITLEESSCVLDIALLANQSINSLNDSDIVKPLRCSSDERSRLQSEKVFLRPRARTTANCKGDLFVSRLSNPAILQSIENHVVHFRNTSLCVGDHVPKRHESINGLIYHSSDHCMHVCCQYGIVSEDVIAFRQKILKSVGLMLTINSKTKKMEMNLAKLKACQNLSTWADPCLYSEICILMSLYSFSRQSRQYIQELFLSIPMSQLQNDMKLCLEGFVKETKTRCSFFTRL